MIKKLKRAAEGMGYNFQPDDQIVYKDRNVYGGKLFNPSEEIGRHWLVKMERTLDDFQWSEYRNKIRVVYLKKYLGKNLPDFERWFKTAPSELCFEKIMEVI